MAGFRAPYVPGWDCHGLPIEYKVVKESRGLSPLEVRKKSEAFARKFVDIQREQFKRLGVLGDWEHPYLTLDPAYEAEILRAFAVFVEKGLVYQVDEAGFLEHRRANRAGRSGSRIPGPRGHGGLVKFPIVTGALERTRRASPSGRRRPGLCRRISPSRSIRRNFTSCRNSGARAKRDACAGATSWSRSFAPRPVSSRRRTDAIFPRQQDRRDRQAQHPFLDRNRRSFWPPISSPWIPAPARSTSRPATARTITR